MPLPTTTRRRLSATEPLPASDARRAELGGFPGRAPAALDACQAGERQARQCGEDQESSLVAAGQLLGVAEARGEIEAAEAARHPDEAGHDADLAPEPLRHQLEDRAVP